MSHPAVVAREFGIPCVVGTHDATTRLRDGQLVEVDGAAGVVTDPRVKRPETPGLLDRRLAA